MMNIEKFDDFSLDTELTEKISAKAKKLAPIASKIASDVKADDGFKQLEEKLIKLVLKLRAKAAKDNGIPLGKATAAYRVVKIQLPE